MNKVKVGVIRHNPAVHKMLRTVSDQEGFHFCVEADQQAKEVAHNLAEFISIVKTVDLAAIEFHFRRGDFEKWFTGIIGDNTLSARTAKIGKDKNGEELRNTLSTIVSTRFDELRRRDPAYTVDHVH